MPACQSFRYDFNWFSNEKYINLNMINIWKNALADQKNHNIQIARWNEDDYASGLPNFLSHSTQCCVMINLWMERGMVMVWVEDIDYDPGLS